ncbi:uncharacterized protein LOC142324190 isoform X3 [Lycorma delicatula]|uniref:uncharacterized protein LOC142324190 isoform X3 n=1 Tax=Lycorma delicatula TaxID=130591 RepID=UPI003F517AC5
MAAEVTADLSLIQDEDVLRRMWQQTEDFGRKKEIRARMYKLREQRLKDFYTTGEVVSDTTVTKHTATKHADSIADQGFLSMKTKEIRDSESPTRDIHRRLQSDNNYWNTVQESYSTSDDGGRLVDSYERQIAGEGVSPDGRTHSQSTASEKNQQSSFLEIKDDSSRQEEQLKHSAQASVSARTKTDDGEMSMTAKKQEERQQSSSYTTSKSGNTTSYSTSKRESSSSSSSSKQVLSNSTSSVYRILPSGERVLISTTTGTGDRALTGGVDDTQTYTTTTRDVAEHRDTNEQIRPRNEKISVSGYNRETQENVRNNYSDNTRFIISEKTDTGYQNQDLTTRNQTYITDEREISERDYRNQDVNQPNRDYSQQNQEYNLRNQEYTQRNQEITQRNQEFVHSEVDGSNVVDQKIMTELQKLDSYLSTQNTTGTSTPVSPHSVTGDAANWTVVSSNNGEFIYKGENDKPYSPSERPALIKHPSSLDLPKEPTEGQYVTTYQQSYQPKRISVEHSPTHDAFARSLRASPPPSTTRSSSKGSLDRSSPDRKFKGPGSPTRSSPEKERRVSVASSYVVEKPKEVKRKVSEAVRGASKETTVKSKRKFSTTQTKAATKVRASTPGTSPSTSPTRMDNNQSPTSSDSESDSSQLTYNKHSTTSSKRKDSSKLTETTSNTTVKTSRTSPTHSSPDCSPPRKSPSPTKTTGILRKDSKTHPSLTIVRSESPVKGGSKSPSISPERSPKGPRDASDRKTSDTIQVHSNKIVTQTVHQFSSKNSLINQKTQNEVSIDKKGSPVRKKPQQGESPDYPDGTISEHRKSPTKIVDTNDRKKLTDDFIGHEKETLTTQSEEIFTTDTQKRKASETVSDKSMDALKRKTSETFADKNTEDTLKRKTNETPTDKNTDVLKRKTSETVIDKSTDSLKRKASETVSDKSMDTLKRKTNEIPTDKSTDTLKRKTSEALADKNTDTLKRKTSETVIDKSTDSLKRKTSETIADKGKKIPSSIKPDFDRDSPTEIKRSPVDRTEPYSDESPYEDGDYPIIKYTADQTVEKNTTVHEDSRIHSTYKNINLVSTTHINEDDTTESQVQERPEKSPVTSPTYLPKQRDKSPEYSSEGSVCKEIKSSRAVIETTKISKEPSDSSPERSAFKPIKCFRTSPEIENIDVKLQELSHPTGAPSPVSPKPQTQSKVNLKPKTSVPSELRETSPTRSPSPTKSAPSKKSPDRETKSSSISPYSSPERTPVKESKRSSISPERRPDKISESPSVSPERKTDKKLKTQPVTAYSKPVQQPTPKLIEKSRPDSVRTTRRSSIPRADQKTTGITKKVSEKKIEIKQRPTSNIRVNSFDHKKPEPKNIIPRTNLHSSIPKQTVTKSYKATSIREVSTKPSTKTPSQTKIKTTAVININKASSRIPSSQPSKVGSNTVINITITPKSQKVSSPTKPVTKSPDKKSTLNKSNILKDRNIIKKEMIKEQKFMKTNVYHKDEYDGSSDRSTSVSSPETVRPAENEKNTTSNVAISMICSSNVRSGQHFTEQDDLKVHEDELLDLENETPPEEFLVNDEESPVTSPDRSDYRSALKPKEKPIATKPAPTVSKKSVTNQQTTGHVRSTVNLKISAKPSPKVPSKTSPVKKATQNAPVKKRLSSESLTRTHSDKSIAKSIAVVKDTTKQDVDKSRTQVTRITTANARKITAETGVATKRVSTAKSATVKSSTTIKKKPVEIKHDKSSSSSDEETEVDIPTNVEIVSQDEQYINELEDMRRREELEYAAKLTATTTQEDTLLNVIIQHPKSSRESSPGYTSHDQPYCTVSDDGGAHPRYADLISEPEDVDAFGRPNKRTPVNEPYEIYPSQKQPQTEQVTDLDEETDTEEKLSVSVADRVSKFLESTQATNTVKVTSSLNENVTHVPRDSPKAVLKAKQMFETIAKNQTAPPAPGNKPVDILSRPSVFEGRRGITTPKDKFETVPQRKSSESPEPVKRINSTQELAEETRHDNTTEENASYVTTTVIRKKSVCPQRIIPDERDELVKRSEKQRSPTPVRDTDVRSKSPSPSRTEPVRKKSVSPTKDIQIKKDAPKETVKKQVSDSTKLIMSETNENIKTKKTEIHSKQNQISSKRDFFEQKAKTEQIVSKGKPVREPVTPLKSRPTIPNKRIPETHSQTMDFIEYEKGTSPRSSPERKTAPSPSRRPEIVSEKPSAIKTTTKEVVDITNSSTTTSRKFSAASFPEQKASVISTKDRRESVRSVSPIKDRKEPVRSVSPTKDRKEPVRSVSPTKDRKEPIRSVSPAKYRKEPIRSVSPAKDRKEPIRSVSPAKDRKEPIRSVSPAKDRKEPIRSVSPAKDRKEPIRSVSPAKDRKEPIRSVSPAKDRKESVRSVSPTKDKKEPVALSSPTKTKKDSVRSFPDQPIPGTNKERKESLPKQKSPERQTKKEFIKEKSPEKSGSPERDFKSPSPERSLPTERKSSIKRTSPERKISVETKTVTEKTEFTRRDSSDRTVLVQKHGDVVELNRAGRFGVTLRRTSSSGSTGTPRRTSMPGGDEIEDIFQLELLEQTLEKAVGYEQRRRIRAQIRVVKKLEEDARSARKQTKFTVKDTHHQSRPTSEETDDEIPDRKKSIPEQKQPIQRPVSPTKSLVTDIKPTETKKSPVTPKQETSPVLRAKSPSIDTKPVETKRSPSSVAPKRETSPVQQAKSPSIDTKPLETKSSPSDVTPRYETSSPVRQVKSPSFDSRPVESKRSPSGVIPKRESSPVHRAKSPSVDVKPRETKRVSSTLTPKQETSSVHQQDVLRKGSKIESTSYTSSSTNSAVRSPAREREPCPITSSYGVGPTDEHGRPLFGLKALRRSNTSKTLTDEVVEQQHIEKQQEVEVTETEEICDARGRPLFGLKALQVSSVDTQEMPEVSSTQLRGLVEKHEQHARERTSTDSQPRQKPKARLRDSFILQSLDDDIVEDNQNVSTVTTTTTTATTPQRGGVSLRSLIQKHEDISSTGGRFFVKGNVHREMESKTTVITSKSTVSSDGSVSLSQDVIKGELSSRNGDEPSGKITHTKYAYQTPDEKNKSHGISSTTTTTTIGGRKSSGPKITEIEDSEDRRSSVISETSSRRYSGAKIIEYDESNLNKMTKDLDEVQKKFSTSRRLSQDLDDDTTQRATNGSSNFVSSAIKKFSSSNKTSEEDEKIQRKSTVSSVKFISSTSSSVKKSSVSSNSTSSTPVTEIKTKTVSSTTASSSAQKQSPKDIESEDDKASDDKKKPLVRGDSVRALQHKFQQATVSSSLKHHSSATSDSSKQKQPSQLSPSGRQIEKQDKSVTSNEESVSSTRISQASTTSNVSTDKSSFLDNTTKVSGVQDILTRMRNADLVVESGDTNEDQEARALLNKFLGASVILQGMEQGMKAHQQQQQQTNGHNSLPASPTSATLVSRVEKQRMASATNQPQEIEDLDNIWDEKQLRELLEDCSDYEGRRKIRARLRNVMAEHKACADVVAVTSDATGNSMLSQGEFPLSILRSQSSQSSGVDDSGTESGEDLRLLSPEVLAEVQGALSKLESALPGLDPNRRESLVQLVNRLQSCLHLQQQPNAPPHPPPRRFANRKLIRQSRHTVGVSREELADARRLLQETKTYSSNRSNPELSISPEPDVENSSDNLQKENESLVTRVFRPVKFNPLCNRSISEDNTKLTKPEELTEELPVIEHVYHKPVLCKAEVHCVTEPEPLSASISYKMDKETERLMGDASGSSLLEYDPSLVLFTPEQSVQIAVHKAAINKQITEEEKRREDSDDGDISSTEEESNVREREDNSEGVSSAQRLLQIATDNYKKNSSNRFHNRSNKKLKMKRANTIDIPKPLNYYEADASSGDDFDRNSTDDGHLSDYKVGSKSKTNNKNIFSINFEPKTLNDMKFLAFLQQSNEKDSKNVTYNPSARGGAPWSNRFSNIKTTFEQPAFTRRQSNPNLVATIKQFWQGESQHDVRHSRTPQPIQKKLPWASEKTSDNEGVVFGSITVAKKTAVPINQFSHAAQSAFKPPEKKLTAPPPPPPPVHQYIPPSVSGTVKKLAAQKFSGQNPSPKPILKHYPSQEKINSLKTSNESQSEKSSFVPYKGGNSLPQNSVINSNNSSHDFSKPYLIPPQKVTSNRVSDVVKSLESEKISLPNDNILKFSVQQNRNLHQQIFKHHIDKVPDSDGHANLRIAPEMSEHIPYDRIIPHHLPLVNDMSSNQISYGNNYSDMSLQTHFAPTSPEQSQNIFIPPAHDTGYSSSIRSNSSVDISPISPGKMNANYFPHNFSPQKQTGDSRTSSIENISAIIRSSNENIHNTSSPSPKVTTPPENLSEQFFGGTPIHVVHNLPTGRISKSSSVEDNVEETLSATSPFWHNEDRPSAFIPYVLLEAQTAISRVMGRPQQAVTVTNKMRHRYENAAKKIESHITSSSQKSSSPNHPHTSPSFPNVLQKSESWHQMVKEKMAQAKQAPPLPKISKAKSSHALAFPKQFEASLPKETLSVKQSTIDQYLKKSPVTTSSSISKSKEKKTVTIKSVIKLDDDLNNVDEAFENLFQETSKKRVNK